MVPGPNNVNAVQKGMQGPIEAYITITYMSRD